MYMYCIVALKSALINDGFSKLTHISTIKLNSEEK